MAPSIIFVVIDHRYDKLPELSINAAAFLIGMALLPDRQAGKPAKILAYLPACIALIAPSIVFTSLDGYYNHALELLVVGSALFIGIATLNAWWRDKPVVEIEHETLTIRMPIYIPTKKEKISLNELHKVVITGPKHSRDWVFYFKDGSKKEFRPRLPFSVGEAVGAILREVNAGRFEVTVEAPLFLEL